jgi:L-asparaginase II
MTNPVLVNNLRGDLVENRHRGAIAVCDPSGRLVRSWGDAGALVYPRSAIKTLQALPLVESGAADHFSLDSAELALACSSHSAEAAHVERVRSWLARIELDEQALECGPHPPYDESAAAALIRDSAVPGRVHNNCSGKHTGMLTTCRFLDEPTRGYIERDHPAQQRWFDALGEMAGVDLRSLPWNLDGCGIPVIAMPLQSIATAFARVAAPDDLAAARGDAIERLLGAIADNPRMIAGRGRLSSEIVALTRGRVIVKSGAQGVYTAALREKDLGIAIKIDDGSGEASEIVLLEVLYRLGALYEDELEALAPRRRAAIVNTIGRVTGYRESALP